MSYYGEGIDFGDEKEYQCIIVDLANGGEERKEKRKRACIMKAHITGRMSM